MPTRRVGRSLEVVSAIIKLLAQSVHAPTWICARNCVARDPGVASLGVLSNVLIVSDLTFDRLVGARRLTPCWIDLFEPLRRGIRTSCNSVEPSQLNLRPWKDTRTLRDIFDIRIAGAVGAVVEDCIAAVVGGEGEAAAIVVVWVLRPRFRRGTV